MLSRALLPLTRVALNRSAFVVRAFGASALINKTAVKAAATSGKKPTPAKAKKAVKPKRTAAAAKPKRAVVKPKRVAVKKIRKADIHEKTLNSKKAIVELPKQAPAAYSLFVRDRWKKVQPREGGENQLAVFASVSREAGRAWRALSESDKQQYHKQREALLAQHVQDVRKWWAGVDRKQVALENQRRRRHNRNVALNKVKGSRLPLLRDPLAPKRPLSAYMMFASEHLAGKSGDSIKDTSRALGAEWKTMSDAAKAPYVSKAAVEADLYKAASQKYASSI
ncbi:hypothetical protein H4S07_000416 [Coemansia furcata]|uniref:Uncharacterized protein n=1 Tax=Coemansia furcata TaxID=417177 RepID=A0ACC1LRI1_9FUNG|nr:hypothetical protein H4S07_000416 [Coemansia furcata]